MILHYIKMAWRNLMKHWGQNVLSVIGLAVGFVCFAYSLIWLRYERTFDSFHPNADRIYRMYEKSLLGGLLSKTCCPFALASSMKESFPEVEAATAFCQGHAYAIQDQSEVLDQIAVDSSFLNLFDVRILAGDCSFLDSDQKVAITPATARKLFGTEQVLGRTLELIHTGDLENDGEKTITALVSEWKGHSNMPYDLLTGIRSDRKEYKDEPFFSLCFRLRQDADTAAFARKLHGDWYPSGKTSHFSVDLLRFCPITECYELLFKEKIQIRQTYIRMFAWIGVLVMVIALINYFSLLVNQMINRSKELALRVVNGSSRWQLFALFAVELILMLLLSGFISLLLMEWTERLFMQISWVQTDWLPLALGYFIMILLCSLLIAGVLILYYARKSLTIALQNRKIPVGRRVSFQRISMIFQFLVSLLVLFCFGVLFCQLTYLSRTEDVGFERTGRASMSISETYRDAFLHDLRAQPYVMEVDESIGSLLPTRMRTYMPVWMGDKECKVEMIQADDAFLRFYGIRQYQDTIQGVTGIRVLLNQTAARSFGESEVIGRKIMNWTVVGIVPDFYMNAPTVPSEPTLLFLANPGDQVLLIRYDEQHTDELKKFVQDWFEKRDTYKLIDVATEVYDNYLVSERMLMRLLGVMAGICVLISLFGVYAHVVLACERRRKEIAIRKVNGATAGLIVRSFLKEYFLLLLVASAFAFPLGTIVMQRWLEQYVLRVGLAWWIYAGIFLLLWIFMMLCIGRSVWRAARENPAEVIKSE